jgi:hypothetical protein
MRRGQVLSPLTLEVLTYFERTIGATEVRPQLELDVPATEFLRFRRELRLRGYRVIRLGINPLGMVTRVLVHRIQNGKPVDEMTWRGKRQAGL